MTNNENILRRLWRMKAKVMKMNKLKPDLSKSLSSSNSVYVMYVENEQMTD